MSKHIGKVVQVIGRTFVLFRQKAKDSQIKLPRAK